MRKIVLENYKKEWKALYEKEASILSGILGLEFVAAHHIGSTAIPGIKAKPIIDILLEVKSIDKVDNYNRQFQSIGYEAKGEYGIKGRRFFQKGSTERTHHVHIFEKNNPEVHRHIKFRDYLIKNKGIAKEYENLKVTLAEKYTFNPEAYSKEKDRFIRSIEKEIE
jgi:GrpB-like predicted nucleotidyltransferase (UPF0157 family)